MNNHIIITPVPSADGTFARALGISAEREAELDSLMDQYHRDTDTYPAAVGGCLNT